MQIKLIDKKGFKKIITIKKIKYITIREHSTFKIHSYSNMPVFKEIIK